MTARVWHNHPPKARPKKAKKSTAQARSSASVLPVPAEESPQALAQPVMGRPAAMLLASAQQTASPQVASPSSGSAAPPPSAQVPIPERAPARRTPKRAKAQPDTEHSWSPWPSGAEPDTTAIGAAPEPGSEPDHRPAWMISSRPPGAPDASALEVAHDSGPGVRGPGEPSAPFAQASWPSPDASLLPLLRPAPQPSPFPEAGAFPEVDPFPEASPVPQMGADHGPESTSSELAASTESASTESASTESASTEYGAPARSESAAGLARKLRPGLILGLGRRPARAAGSATPASPAEASPRRLASGAASGGFASAGLVGCRGWPPGTARPASGTHDAGQASGRLDAPRSVPSG